MLHKKSNWAIEDEPSIILIENYIKHHYKMTKNNSSACLGDLQSIDQTNFEIKISTGGNKHNQFNYVQLRMNHNCNYLLTAYYIDDSNIDMCGELFIFRVNKVDIKKIIMGYGSYAHGTKQKLGAITPEDLDNPDNNKEYAIRPKYGDKCWHALLQFRVYEGELMGFSPLTVGFPI